MDSEKMTLSKRLTALVRAIGYLGSQLILFSNPNPDSTSHDGFLDPSEMDRMKANFAYFLGNPKPMEAIRQTDKALEESRKKKKE